MQGLTFSVNRHFVFALNLPKVENFREVNSRSAGYEPLLLLCLAFRVPLHPITFFFSKSKVQAIIVKKSKKIRQKICFSPAHCIIFAHAETKMSHQKHFSARHHTHTLPHLHTPTPHFADVAQLVERNLAKVEVAGSNLVIRSLPSSEGFFIALLRKAFF